MKYTKTGSIRVSPSELKTADTCLRKYYYSYIKEIKIPKKYNFGFALGVALHSALEEYFTHKRDNENIILNHWNLVKTSAKENWIDEEEFNNIPEQQIIKRIFCLFKAIKAEIDIKTHKILGVEEHLTAPLDKFHELHGFIDIRYEDSNGVTKVGDWKFGKNTKAENALIEYWYQFVGYRFLHEQVYHKTPDILMHTGSISLAETPKQPYKYAQIKVEFPYEKFYKDLHDRAKSLTEYVLRSGDDVEICREKYPKTGRSSGICNYCEYNDICNGSVEEPTSDKSKLIEVVNDSENTRNKDTTMEEC